MPSAIFLTGTDTEVGKTFVACSLLEAWKAHGLRVAGFKPVAAGAIEDGGKLANDDARRLQAASSAGITIEAINPVCLRAPIAPHLAAAAEGVAIDPTAFYQAFQFLSSRVDRVVVEGVGGFRVPIGGSYDMADFAVALGLPVVLVVGLRLGCINHALLTVEAIAKRNLVLCGWIGNVVDPSMGALQGNMETLRHWIAAPCLGLIERQSNPDPRLTGLTLKLPF